MIAAAALQSQIPDGGKPGAVFPVAPMPMQGLTGSGGYRERPFAGMPD